MPEVFSFIFSRHFISIVKINCIIWSCVPCDGLFYANDNDDDDDGDGDDNAECEKIHTKQRTTLCQSQIRSQCNDIQLINCRFFVRKWA